MTHRSYALACTLGVHRYKIRRYPLLLKTSLISGGFHHVLPSGDFLDNYVRRRERLIESSGLQANTRLTQVFPSLRGSFPVSSQVPIAIPISGELRQG